MLRTLRSYWSGEVEQQHVVSNFILSCDLAGISRHNSFFLYVNGYHLSLPRSDLNECLVRAECLRYIRQAWIDRFV